MPIVKSEIIEQSKQASGFRVKFKYTFADFREFTVGPINAIDQEQINKFLIDKKSPLESSVKSNDAEEAKSLGLKTAYKDASQPDVYFSYLEEGYNEQDALESYLLMKPVAQDILALQLTVEQMAAIFNQPVEMVNSVMDKWLYLELNEDKILAYKAVKDGM